MSGYLCERCRRYRQDDDNPLQLVRYPGQPEMAVCDDCANEIAAKVDDGQIPPIMWNGRDYRGEKAV